MQISLDKRDQPGSAASPARGRRRERKGEKTAPRADVRADLSAYTLKQRLIIRAADLGFYVLINLIGRTVRFRVEGREHWEAVILNG